MNTPPSRATNQYPRPVDVAAIPTIGWLSTVPPVDPRNGASPKVKIPPSRATSHEPFPVGVRATPTTGWFSDSPPDAP